VELEWIDGTVDLRCPVCSHESSQQLLARADMVWRDEHVDIARCSSCGAVVLGAILPPSEYSDTDWDFYVEVIAGVEAIADTLAQSGLRRGGRMLDVGCGYGFALDLARFVFDYEGIGLDPSVAAERGRRELGLDIRPGTLDDAFEPDERFDVIFSSEVIEHVADPREFLAAIRRRLHPKGIVVLTTPDAAYVRPDSEWNVLFAVLSVGLHEFLVDAAGFEKLLVDAGFHARIWNVGAGLRAVAALDPEMLANVSPEVRVPLGDLASYCEERGASAEPGSALAVGMAMRHLKWMMAEGDFARASTHVPVLAREMKTRHNIDIDDPCAIVGRKDVPAVATAVFYNLGLLHLWHERNPQKAAKCFEAAAHSGRAHYEIYRSYADPETPAYEALARAHLASVLAQVDPDRVAAVLDEIDASVERDVGDAALAADARTRAEGELKRWRSPSYRVYRRMRSHLGRARRALKRHRQTLTPGRRWSGRRA
jgi:2-polyprenyl-3-methyl-5-hydroxy-6-metoxy-1,4-benzoquinol methylase